MSEAVSTLIFISTQQHTHFYDFTVWNMEKEADLLWGTLQWVCHLVWPGTFGHFPSCPLNNESLWRRGNQTFQVVPRSPFEKKNQNIKTKLNLRLHTERRPESAFNKRQMLAGINIRCAEAVERVCMWLLCDFKYKSGQLRSLKRKDTTLLHSVKEKNRIKYYFVAQFCPLFCYKFILIWMFVANRDFKL